MAAEVTGVVVGALQRFGDRITRVEVHLGDENGPKHGQNEKRCMMEARLKGRRPIAVTHHATTLEQAVHGAADNLIRAIASTLGRAAHLFDSHA
jgi:Sigma 54 modulation protein / S30EA ribosomal protein